MSFLMEVQASPPAPPSEMPKWVPTVSVTALSLLLLPLGHTANPVQVQKDRCGEAEAPTCPCQSPGSA